ncbi:SDR family NAD(P)-dependent oxidoreductase [Kribbella swartbergensis]
MRGADGRTMLVNNVGTGVTGPIEGADIAQWKAMLDVNVLGVLHCTHAALPRVRVGLVEPGMVLTELAADTPRAAFE